MVGTTTNTAGEAVANWDTSKHPAGLYVLFFTEMWERFSYYGMRALLVFYMIKQLAFTQQQSSQVYGLYTGLVYLTPIFGGIIADRYLGQRRTVILGGVLMAIGHFLMAFEPMFFPALGFLVLGNGAFKPNISTQVGALYAEGDPRRDRAFSIFYVGINLGAFFSPLICGTLGEVYGWHYGFAAAGVGMVIGLLTYMWGQKHLASDNVMNVKASKATKETNTTTTTTKEKLTTNEKGRIGSLVVLCMFTIIFWAVYEQQGNTLALWADSNTDRFILGWQVPASWLQALNPAMIFMFTPFVLTLWKWQQKRQKEPSSITKMAIGCIFLGASFLVMIPPAQSYAVSSQPVSMWWLVGCTFLLTIGELYLSPVGLSLVTKLAPVRMVSMLMGMWLLSSFFGNSLSGFMGTFWTTMSKEGFFMMLSALSFVAAFGFFMVRNPLRALTEHKGDKKTAAEGTPVVTSTVTETI